MTVLTTDRTQIVLPRDALVEVRTPSGEFIGYYKLEALGPDEGVGEASRPSARPAGGGESDGAQTPG